MAQHSNRPDRRRAAHSKTTQLRPGYELAGRAGHNTAPDRPYPGADHPSWPAGAAGGDWPQPGTDYGNWPATADQPSWFEGGDHPSWPASDAGGWQQGQAPVVQHHDERWQAPAPAPPRAPVPVTRWEYPARAAGAHAKTGQWSAKLARTQDTAPQTYYELAFGDGRLQVMLTEPPATDQRWATSGHAPVEVLLPDGQQAGPAGWQDLQNSDSIRVAERILSDADYQAAEIRREAAAHATAVREAAEQEAAEIRRQAAAQAAPVREAADREAAEVRQQAADQAAAIREVAQREAEALQSDVRRMSAELDHMAAYITEKFTGPIERVTGDISPAEGRARAADASAAPADGSTRTMEGYPEPADAFAAPAPAVAPYGAPPPQREADLQEKAAAGARAASRAAPATLPRTPGTQPAGPATLPARKDARKDEQPGKPRQYRTMRVFAGTIAALVVVAVGTGAYQLATRGYTFFIFRSAGTGATDNNAVFPGTHPAPKPSASHHQPSTGRHARAAHHHRHHRGTQHQ